MAFRNESEFQSPEVSGQPRIELLYFDGCPNHDLLLERIAGLLDGAGITTPLILRHITDVEDAQRARFLGSPSVRIDGSDIEPGADERNDYGLKCRIYRSADGLSGLPPDEWIIAALDAATGVDG